MEGKEIKVKEKIMKIERKVKWKMNEIEKKRKEEWMGKIKDIIDREKSEECIRNMSDGKEFGKLDKEIIEILDVEKKVIVEWCEKKFREMELEYEMKRKDVGMMINDREKDLIEIEDERN